MRKHFGMSTVLSEMVSDFTHAGTVYTHSNLSSSDILAD